MKGSYRIIVQSAHLRYEMEIIRNITILRGDSATGKTVLVEMIQEYILNGSDTGILENPSAFIDGEEFFSWEKFFTHLLSAKTSGTYLAYTKTSLNPNYLIGKVYTQIIDTLPGPI